MTKLKNRLLDMRIERLLLGSLVGFAFVVIILIPNIKPVVVDIEGNSLTTNRVFSVQNVETKELCYIIFYQGDMYVPVTYVKEPSYGSFIVTNETIETFLTYE